MSLLFPSYIKQVTHAVNVTIGTSRSAQGGTSDHMILTTRKWLCRDAGVCPKLTCVALQLFLCHTDGKQEP